MLNVTRNRILSLQENAYRVLKKSIVRRTVMCSSFDQIGKRSKPIIRPCIGYYQGTQRLTL
jgi:hypothetical protein